MRIYSRPKWYQIWGEFHQIEKMTSVKGSMIQISFISKCCNKEFNIDTRQCRFLSNPRLKDRCTNSKEALQIGVNDRSTVTKFGDYMDKIAWGVCQQSGKLIGVQIHGETDKMVMLVERHSGYNYKKVINKLEVYLSKKDALIFGISHLNKAVVNSENQLSLLQSKLKSVEQQLKVVNDENN